MEFIAEIGSNWRMDDYSLGASKAEALRLCEHVASAGATIIKFQIFEADTLYSKERAPDLWERVKPYEFPIDWLSRIWGKANDLGLKVWASVFSPDLVRLTSMYVHGLKIASGDIVYHDLVHEVARICGKHGLTMAISTGAATMDEIRDAIKIINSHNVEDVIIFYCVSAYPAPQESFNLRSGVLYHDLGGEVGLSDHSEDSYAAELAVGLGYQYFEKHFWSGNKDVKNSPDLCVSLNPDEMRLYIDNIKFADSMFGTFDKKVSRFEIKERTMARRGEDGLRPKK
jgi:sialic acid synthase SpsE